MLWNYPVGENGAGRRARRGAQTFLSRMPLWLNRQEARAIVSICGHASSTGEAASNERLARERAENVAAYLRTLGIHKLEVGSAGSSQPADPAPNGQALARNRRVEVTLFNPTIQPPPRIDPTPTPTHRQPRTRAAARSGSATYWEGDVKWPPVPAPIETAVVAAEFSLVGKVKVKSTTGEPLQEVGFVTEGGKLSAEVVGKIGENLEGKLGFDPGGRANPDRRGKPRRGGVDIPVEAGFQTELNFFKVEVSLAPVMIPEIEVDGVKLSLEIEGTVLVEWGVSKVLLGRVLQRAGISLRGRR